MKLRIDNFSSHRAYLLAECLRLICYSSVKYAYNTAHDSISGSLPIETLALGTRSYFNVMLRYISIMPTVTLLSSILSNFNINANCVCTLYEDEFW